MSHEKIKWIINPNYEKKNLSFSKNLRFFFLKKIFYQEKKIFRNEKITKKLFNSKKIKNLIFFLSSILYIFAKSADFNSFFFFKILNFIIKKKKFKKFDQIKKLIIGCKKFGIIFDTFVFGKKDFPLFHKMCGKTDGIYCRPSKNFVKISFTEELIDILVSIFLPIIFIRQLFILPFSTRTSKQEKLIKNKKKINFLCSNCYSFFVFFPTSCFICGLDLIL
jgi:hypothetical protein